ncbi:hypothetical protein DFH06DRAFT_1471288 [Mycena polygramma]|nr:hypothetical protein DFH06DRAFT_1471288 [Mycena polygramma]
MTTDIDLTAPPPDYDFHTMNADQKDKNSTTSSVPGTYIYYRVYTSDGAIPSKSAFDSSNPFIGRITARSVPPPHIVASLKRCVAGAENISEDSTKLYLNQSARSLLDSSTKVTIRGVGNDPGKTLETAFALIIVGEMTPEQVAAVDAVDLSQYREGSEYYATSFGSRMSYQVFLSLIFEQGEVTALRAL